MTASNPLARSLQPLRHALVAAGSPHHWHCQLRDALRQWQPHSHPAEWFAVLTAPDLEIGGQPLYGENLAQLMAPEAMAGDVVAASRAGGRRPPARSRSAGQQHGVPGTGAAPDTAGEKSRAMVPLGSGAQRYAPPPRAEEGNLRQTQFPSPLQPHASPQHLQRRAGAALLKRLCSSQELQPAPTQANPGLPSRLMLSPAPASRRALAAPPVPTAAAGMWSSRLAGRTSRSLPRLVGALRGSPALSENWNWSGPALASQWSVPLAGITAPHALVSRWQQVIPEAREAPPASPSGAVSAASKPVRTDSGRLSGAQARSPRREQPAGAPALPAPEVQPLDGQPAGLAPLLSYLVRPEQPRLPAPLAGAEAEPLLAIDPEEELEELASKIKRILDEEAQRHGIDV